MFARGRLLDSETENPTAQIPETLEGAAKISRAPWAEMEEAPPNEGYSS